MRVYQSRLNGELLLAYEVFRCHEYLEPDWKIKAVEWVSLGVLIECRTGYAGIFKSFEVLERQTEFIGEL